MSAHTAYLEAMQVSAASKLRGMNVPDEPAQWTTPHSPPEIDDSWYIRSADMPVRLTAGGVIVRWKGPQLMLAVTRVKDGPVTITELPRSGIEPGETAEHAARREIREETGLHQLDLLLTEPLTAHGRAGLRKGIWIKCCWYLYFTRQTDARPTEAGHELLWRPFDQPGLLSWPGERRLLEEEHGRVIKIAMSITSD